MFALVVSFADGREVLLLYRLTGQGASHKRQEIIKRLPAADPCPVGSRIEMSKDLRARRESELFFHAALAPGGDIFR